MEDLDFNVSVVGLGVIGGSLAYRLKKLNIKNVWGIDQDRSTLSEAEKRNMIDKGFHSPEPEYPLQNSDIVILSVYPHSSIEFIKKNMQFFKTGAIILDTVGVKRSIVSEINDIIRKDIDFIGGHPMAGNEGKGILSASEKLFNNANFLLTPIHNNKKENIQKIERLLIAMGFGRISKITPEKHDEMIGYTSQLPHIIAASLINCNDNMDVLRFTGNSFGEFTRIAKMNAPLWAQLIMENGDNVIGLIDAFMKEMMKIRNTVSERDLDLLEDIFKACTKKKEEMK